MLRLADAQSLDQGAESFAVLREVNGVGRRAEDRGTESRQGPGDLERRLPAELHDDPARLLRVDDIQDVLEHQGSK